MPTATCQRQRANGNVPTAMCQRRRANGCVVNFRKNFRYNVISKMLAVQIRQTTFLLFSTSIVLIFISAFVDFRTMLMFLQRIHTLHGVTISFSRSPCLTLISSFALSVSSTFNTVFFSIFQNLQISVKFWKKKQNIEKNADFWKSCKILQDFWHLLQNLQNFQKSAKLLQNFLQTFTEICRFWKMLKDAILDAKISENLAKIWRNFDKILTRSC